MAFSHQNSLHNELNILKKSILKDDSCKIENDREDTYETSTEMESILITYSLSKKNRSKKMLFNYELIGRCGKEGILQKMGGRKVTLGCIIIPLENEEEIETFLKNHNVDFSKMRITLH